MTSYYLSQWLLRLLTHTCATWPQRVNIPGADEGCYVKMCFKVASNATRPSVGIAMIFNFAVLASSFYPWIRIASTCTWAIIVDRHDIRCNIRFITNPNISEHFRAYKIKHRLVFWYVFAIISQIEICHIHSYSRKRLCAFDITDTYRLISPHPACSILCISKANTDFSMPCFIRLSDIRGWFRHADTVFKQNKLKNMHIR